MTAASRFWFAVYDLANALRWPFLRWAKRWTRTELWLIRLAVYAQGRGFGWND